MRKFLRKTENIFKKNVKTSNKILDNFQRKIKKFSKRIFLGRKIIWKNFKQNLTKFQGKFRNFSKKI